MPNKYAPYNLQKHYHQRCGVDGAWKDSFPEHKSPHMVRTWPLR